MNSKKTVLIILLGFVFLMVGAYLLYHKLDDQIESPQMAVHEEPDGAQQEQGDTASREEVPAPDFVVYDLDGRAVRLYDFLGKPVVLNFWASWCGPCQSEMPDFDQACAEYGDDIHFLMVNVTDGARETVDTASLFIQEKGYAFPVYYDTDREAATVFGVNSLPITYFIDAEGHAVAYGLGAMNLETLQTGIDMIYEA